MSHQSSGSRPGSRPDNREELVDAISRLLTVDSQWRNGQAGAPAIRRIHGKTIPDPVVDALLDRYLLRSFRCVMCSISGIIEIAGRLLPRRQKCLKPARCGCADEQITAASRPTAASSKLRVLNGRRTAYACLEIHGWQLSTLRRRASTDA